MAFLAQSKQHQPPHQHRSRGRLDPDGTTEGRPRGLPLVSSVLLAFGIYVTIFANSESFGAYAQVLAVSAIVLSASTAFIFGSSARVVRPALGWYGLSLIGMTISSVVSACMTEEDYALKYTPVFFVMTAAFMILSRQISVRQLETIMRSVFACAVITLIAADAHTISQSLDVSNMLHWSLRYRPFDTHPNLAGLTYGFGLVLCVNGAISRKGIGRYISLGCAAGCTLILLATSSRASFLASTASLFLCHLMKFRYLSTKRKMLVLCLIAVALMPTLLRFGPHRCLSMESLRNGFFYEGRLFRWHGPHRLVGGGPRVCLRSPAHCRVRRRPSFFRQSHVLDRRLIHLHTH